MSFSIEFISNSEQETARFAKALASIAKVRDVFLLNGTLGVGKTVFARAFVQSVSNASEVPSPTFTLLQNYLAKEFEIYHMDLYRLESPEEIFELGIEEIIYNSVTLIEWSEKMGRYLPRDAFVVDIEYNGEHSRKIVIHVISQEKQKRLEGLKYE